MLFSAVLLFQNANVPLASVGMERDDGMLGVGFSDRVRRIVRWTLLQSILKGKEQCHQPNGQPHPNEEYQHSVLIYVRRSLVV